MANQLGTRQWRLDTPVAFGNPNATLWPTNVKVAHIELTNYVAQGNKAIVKDQTGALVAYLTGASDLKEVRTGKIGWVDGLVLDTLDSGIVIVYVE